MKKRIFSILVAMCLVLSMIPTVSGAAFADTRYVKDSDVKYPVTGGNIYFDASTGSIIGCDTSVTSAVIPEQINGVAVENIGKFAFSSCSSLESVEIPTSVASIGGYAFSYCDSLKSVEIPTSVASIEDDTFNGCSSLEIIEIPTSVTSIGIQAFIGCTSLKSVEIPTSVASIGEGAFSYCTSLKSVKIPASVASIEDYTFYGCSSLEIIEIPESVTSIGDWAFWYCSSLTTIKISTGVTSIGDFAFQGCSSLETIEIPESVTTIGEDAFDNCSKLQYIIGIEGSYAEQYAKDNNIAFQKKQTHTHCVCGSEHKNIGDHTAENELTFTAWTDTLAAEQNGEGKTAANSLPSVAGNYYLTEDVTLTETWKPKDNTVLCLGGYEVSISLGKYTTYTEVVCVEDSIKFTLADCSTEQGKIKGINHDDINQTLRIKGAGSFEMYGGSIEGAGFDIWHPIFGIQFGDNHDDKNAQFNMYGGSIANARYGIRVRDTLNMYGGSINDCVEYGVEFDNLDHAATATMSGGSIHDCGCGVLVREGVIFNMSGGSIKKNGKDEDSSYKPSHRGGVSSFGGGIFNLSGGTIEGNVNDQDWGAGVYGVTFNMSGGSVKNNIGGGVRASSITLSCSAQIINNTLNDKTITENLRVYSGKTITINSLSETAKIGITTEIAPTAGNPVTFTSNAVSNFDGKLFSDNAAYEISANDDGTLALKIKKVNPTLTIPTATATYGQKLSDIRLNNPSGNTEGTWEWMDGTQSVGDASDIPKTFKAKFIPSDTRTYNTVENIDISVTVNPKPLTNDMLKIDGEQAEYKGSAVDAKFTVYDGETLLVKGSDYEITSGGKANAVEATTLTIKGLGNYTGEATATWSPKKVNVAEIISEDTIPGISIVIADDCEDGKLSFTLETDETMQKGLKYMVWVSKKDAEFEDWQLVSAQDGVYSADLGENEIEVHVYILGDVNMDGKLNVGDSSDILRSIANDSNLSGLQSALTDFNSDGNINVGDVSDMLRFIANN